MNPQRLVAAVAALAIGFGVTLVGVGFADDETVVSQDEPVDVDAPDRSGAPAEQAEEPAPEPVPAEIEEPPASPVEVEPAGDNGSTSASCKELVAAGASDEVLSSAGCNAQGSESDQEVPDCFPVLEIVTIDGRVLVLTDGFEEDGSGEFVLSGESAAILDSPLVTAVVPHRAAQTDVDDVYLDCDDNFEFEDVNGDGVLETIKQFDDSFNPSDDVEDGAPRTTTGGGLGAFPCGLPVRQVLDDIPVDGFIDLDGDGAESDWEAYITLLDVSLARRTGNESFDWGVQVASTAGSTRFQQLDCGVAQDEWDQIIEAPLEGEPFDPVVTVCFLVQFVELGQRSDGELVNPFIEYLDGFSPATAGCEIDPTLTNPEA